MKSNLIQFVGIPGSGKSYLLEKYFEKYGEDNIELIEFGENLRKMQKNDSKKLDIKKYVEPLIEIIKQREKFGVMTSHIVHKENESFTCDLKHDLLLNSIAYVHIITEPNQLNKQREDDTQSKKRIRPKTNETELVYHQKLSLLKTIEVSTKLKANLLIIHNTYDKLDENLELLNSFFKGIYKKTYTQITI